MSQTRKDSPRRRYVLSVVRKEDYTFAFYDDERLIVDSVPLSHMTDVFCARFGYCQDEYSEVMKELEQSGRAFPLQLVENLARRKQEAAQPSN